MIENIMNLALFGVVIALFIGWVKAVINGDGKCHMDCDHCPYRCSEEEKRRNGHE